MNQIQAIKALALPEAARGNGYVSAKVGGCLINLWFSGHGRTKALTHGFVRSLAADATGNAAAIVALARGISKTVEAPITAYFGCSSVICTADGRLVYKGAPWRGPAPGALAKV